MPLRILLSNSRITQDLDPGFTLQKTPEQIVDMPPPADALSKIWREVEAAAQPASHCRRCRNTAMCRHVHCDEASHAA